MGSTGSDVRDDPYTVVVECLENPAASKSRLPRLVGMFDRDERKRRLCAAWGCCLLASELDDDSTVEYLVRRLSDRLSEEDISPELTTTLDYLSTRYPEQVETVLDEMNETRGEYGDVPLPRPGNFTRANYYKRDYSRDGVGRTRIEGEGSGESRRVHDRSRETRQQDDPDSDSSETEPGEASGQTGPMAEERTEVTSIAMRSRFDQLHILATRERGRFADIHDALVGVDGEEVAVALRLLHEPTSPADQRDFRHRIERRLSEWERVANIDNVVSVLEWGIEPRPWLAAAFTGETLADREQLPPPQALADAVALAGAVSGLHNRGVVHGGLDCQSVIYPEDIVESSTTAVPFLDNVGLMAAFRFHFQPSLLVDPRFAAPEYFDSQYGSIGPSTDIYHLGAVVYYLITGQPPFDGEFETVRSGVLEEKPPAPSTIAEWTPEALDEILSKAMAKQKLTRYETVEHFEQELAALTGEQDG